MIFLLAAMLAAQPLDFQTWREGDWEKTRTVNVQVVAAPDKEVAEGQMVLTRLEENLSTGHAWETTSEGVKRVGNLEKKTIRGNAVVGQSSFVVFAFTPNKPGKYKLVFYYARHGECPTRVLTRTVVAK